MLFQINFFSFSLGDASTSTGICATNNNGCAHVCTPPDGVCSCESGYSLDADGKNCVINVGFNVAAGEIIVLDTDAFPAGYSFSSLAVAQGGVLTATGSNPLIITVDTSVDIQGTINLNGSKGGNSAGDHKAAGGGAGGGALRIQAATITVGSSGAITVDGGDGGDGGAPDQSFFPNPYSDEVAGDGSGGVGIAGGFNGGAGGASNQDGFPGEGPGASQGSPSTGGVPPGAGGAGHAWYVDYTRTHARAHTHTHTHVV